MIKAIGQNGLDFIASKYKELKTLISKKADKTEIITQEERKQLELDRKGYSTIILQELESKLKSSADYVLRYPKASHLVLFNFVQEVKDGKIKPPEGTQVPYVYSLQSWLLKDESNHMYVICDENMKPFTLDYLSKVSKTSQAQCLVYNAIVEGIDSYFSASRALTATTEYFVKQEDGKTLSSNDYTNADKAKIQTIPTVVDNLTTGDATKALSASQGKILQDNKADKSNISRCKTKGYNTSNTWQSLGTERDLEDWIGDFDKRTRELKNNKGLTGDKSEIEQEIIKNSRDPNSGGFVLAKWGRIVSVTGFFDTSSGSTSMSADIPVKFSPLDGCEFLCDQGTIGFNVYRDSSGRVNRCEAVVNADSNRHYKTVRWNVVFFSASA